MLLDQFRLCSRLRPNLNVGENETNFDTDPVNEWLNQVGEKGLAERLVKKSENVEELIAAWRTNNRVTIYLIENLPSELWSKGVPSVPRRTIRTIAAHLHNARCMWIKMIGARHGVLVPRSVNHRTVKPAMLAKALERSSNGMIELIELGAACGGKVPSADWQNFPTDLPHFVAYFVAHEAHHRGQLCLLARQLGHSLPREVTSGLWQWKKRARE